jgi:hypothetical protein
MRADGHPQPLIVAVRVTPGSARTAVGGRRGDALVVRVTEAAVDGRATEATLAAVARALGVSRSAVRLSRGASSRDKLLAVDAPTAEVVKRLSALLTL